MEGSIYLSYHLELISIVYIYNIYIVDRGVLTITSPILFGYSCCSKERNAVVKMADPVPSIILSNTQKVMNTQPEGKATANLQACIYKAEQCRLYCYNIYKFVGMQ